MELNEQILSNMIRKGMSWVLALLEETDDKKIAMVITKHDGEKAYLRIELEDREELYDKVWDYFNNHKTEDVSLGELKEKFKVEDIFLVDILDELKEDGEIYEPKEGIYRYL